MNYELIKATKENIDILIKYKFETIFEYNKAINLYKKYDFKIIDKTESRYFMKRG